MQLPASEDLEINHLTSVFEDVTTSYKYYWFLAILNHLKNNQQSEIHISELIYEMIADVWYAVNYFNLSFGSQDKLSEKIGDLMGIHKLRGSIKKGELLTWMKVNREDKTLQGVVSDLSRYVPYRFLSPWFSNELRGVPDQHRNKHILINAEKRFETHQPIMYKYKEYSIEINPRWKAYMLKHLGILTGFTKYKLLQYLQKHNSNVPGITEKLTPPNERNLHAAKKFWRIYSELKGELHCIYTNEQLNPKIISIDHFIPWSFVAHDQIWNLVPVNRTLNSSKGNRLPAEKYINDLSSLHFDAFQTVREIKSQKKILEDYVVLFKKDLKTIADYPENEFLDRLKNNFQPAIQIASSMGFQENWSWGK